MPKTDPTIKQSLTVAMTEQTKTPETDAVPNRITWQPIDTAPKDGTELLLSCPTGDAIANGAWIGLGWAWPYLRREPAYWQHMPLLPGHYEDEGGICNVCGGGIRYGERHYRCGESVMKIERERDELRAENERLRTIVPGTVERLNDELCDENETLRTERDAARAERDAAVVANCPALCHEFCNAYQVHKRVWEVETNLSRAIAERDAAREALRELNEATSAIYPSFEAGADAQLAWSDRIDCARQRARAVLEGKS